MEFRTRHIMFSFQGLLAVILALHNDMPTLQTQVTAWIPTIIGMIDWFSAQVQKYKGIYNQNAGQSTFDIISLFKQIEAKYGLAPKTS